MNLEEKRNGKSNGVIVAPARPANDNVTVHTAERARYSDGWRAGKPQEDPAKLKKWGFISAMPSEYLIKMRRGEVIASGQGATYFKWPWDSVAIIPTTVQKLHFTADQVTSEKVGVQVTGLAVYRIAEPLIAFRMLNFSFPERASEKLEQMLAEMFIGAARRLVANLSVEQCLSKRKEGLANELMREIAPVVSGHGRVEDRTHKGWGVVIDTIEIQDVRVLSAQVFSNMQARFRQEQLRIAREAELARERSIKQDEAAAERQIELTKVAASQEIRRQKQSADEAARLEQIAAESRVAEAKLQHDRAARQGELANERDLALAKLSAELEVKQQKQSAEEQARLNQLAAEARMNEARLTHERAMANQRMQAEVEKARLEAEAQAARHQAELAAEQQEIERAQASLQLAQVKQQLAQLEVQTIEIESRKTQLSHELELGRARGLREIENDLSPERIQLAMAQQLPAIASAFQQKMGTVNVTAVDGANPFGYIAAAVEGVIGLAKSAGLKFPPPAPAPEKPTDESL